MEGYFRRFTHNETGRWHPWLLGGRAEGAAIIGGESWELTGVRVYGEERSNTSPVTSASGYGATGARCARARPNSRVWSTARWPAPRRNWYDGPAAVHNRHDAVRFRANGVVCPEYFGQLRGGGPAGGPTGGPDGGPLGGGGGVGAPPGWNCWGGPAGGDGWPNGGGPGGGVCCP